MSEAEEDPVAPLRRAVQQKLGRCIMRLQQFELLSKRLASNEVITTLSTEFRDTHTKNAKDLSTQTLGRVVGELTGSFLVVENPEFMGQEADLPPDPSLIRIRSSFHLELDASEHEQVEGELAELVDLRNDLVHHFIEKYDVWSVSGCQAADVYLQKCYSKIDAHFLKLSGWANGMKDFINAYASFIATPEYELLLNERLSTGPTIDWPRTEIVSLLRGTEPKYAKDGWTLLSDAIASIKISHPDQTPKKYGCSSWRHVIHESRLFEIRKSDNSGSVQIWYRSRS